jgi:RNA polymerase sigma-70 factor (ECF subfamily)
LFSVAFLSLTLGDCPAIPLGVMSTTTLSFETVTRSALLFQAQRGHRESLAKLLLPYAAGLYLGALRLTRNHSDAEDARQDAFLKVISRLGQFVGARAVDEKRDDLRAWVSRIGANTSIDLIRKRRHGKLFSLEDPAGAGEETLGSTITTRNHNPEERFARREMRGLMARSIRQLAPDLRRVCLMRDVLEYSTQEVADRLGVTPLTVRLRLFRARRQLREKLNFSPAVPPPVPPKSNVSLPTKPN